MALQARSIFYVNLFRMSLFRTFVVLFELHEELFVGLHAYMCPQLGQKLSLLGNFYVDPYTKFCRITFSSYVDEIRDERTRPPLFSFFSFCTLFKVCIKSEGSTNEKLGPVLWYIWSRLWSRRRTVQGRGHVCGLFGWLTLKMISVALNGVYTPLGCFNWDRFLKTVNRMSNTSTWNVLVPPSCI